MGKAEEYSDFRCLCMCFYLHKSEKDWEKKLEKRRKIQNQSATYSYRFITNFKFSNLLHFSDPQKKDLPETKNVQGIAIEHHVIKIEAQERGHREISKTGNVRMKALMAGQKTRGAQKSVKQGRSNWLYIHLISSFLWSCILWFSLQLFKGTPVSSSRH